MLTASAGTARWWRHIRTQPMISGKCYKSQWRETVNYTRVGVRFMCLPPTCIRIFSFSFITRKRVSWKPDHKCPSLLNVQDYIEKRNLLNRKFFVQFAGLQNKQQKWSWHSLSSHTNTEKHSQTQPPLCLSYPSNMMPMERLTCTNNTKLFSIKLPETHSNHNLDLWKTCATVDMTVSVAFDVS